MGITPILKDMDISENEKMKISDVLVAVLSMPKEIIRQVMESVFDQVYFQNEMAKTPMKLAGNEEMAFAELILLISL